jgi:hypothetical protein
VFKIFEELSIGMQEHMEHLAERIGELEKENLTLKTELEEIRKRGNK